MMKSSKSSKFIALIFILTVKQLQGIEYFEYAKSAELWDYLNSNETGFSILPVHVQRKNMQDAFFEDSKSLHDRIISASDEQIDSVIKDIINMLDSNQLGFLYASTALANTGKESKFIKLALDNLGDDPRRNYIILYALYCLWISDGASGSNITDEIKNSVLNKIKFPVVSTHRFKNITNYLINLSRDAK